MNCPRCGSGMEPGHIVDQGHGTRAVPKSVAGLPQTSIWTGLKLRGLDQVDVATYPCRRCGYLESYAIGLKMRALKAISRLPLTLRKPAKTK